LRNHQAQNFLPFRGNELDMMVKRVIPIGLKDETWLFVSSEVIWT